MLSNVGTNTAMYGVANSIKRYSNAEVYYLDILGEFSKYNNQKPFYLKFLSINKLIPTTGKISKILIFFFSILSIPFLIKQIYSKKPNIIISGLVGFIPCIMKFLYPRLIIINSIQGYPKFNVYRKLIWRIFYKKSDYLITMTNKTKEMIQQNISIPKNKIFVIENPVISSDIKKMSKEKIDPSEKFLFKKDVFCAIGRLTHQKNFVELINFIKDIKLKNFNLIIIGDGEQKDLLKKFIDENDIKNCYLLGFKNNPYKYLANSKIYICTSLWEEPGHTLLEAGYLNIPVLSSNCPNGPDEIIKNKFNGLKYKLGNKEDFQEKLILLSNMSKSEKKSLCLNMKKKISSYTQFQFSKNFNKMIN